MSLKKRNSNTRRPHQSDVQRAWLIVYYLTQEKTAPAIEFLQGCPPAIRAQFVNALNAVAAAPPPRFTGGGTWEAMHGAMGGWYEIRLTGPRREQFRLFCLLENGASEELAKRGLKRPAIAVITGMRKPWRTTFSEREYQRVRALGNEHQQNYPRRIAT
jgi:hypothetical protein